MERQGTVGLAVTLVGLYAAQSVTGSMVQTALPVVLRDGGMGLDGIGWLSLLFIPWVLKPLWAPLVDRYGTARGWILACQALLALSFVAAAAFSPLDRLAALTPFLLLMAVLAATQDIATDAAGVHATTPQNRYIASGASTFGGYAGFLIGGGLWLLVYARHGWSVSMLLLAVVMLLLALPVLRLRSGASQGAGRLPSVRAILQNRRLLAGAGLMLIWQAGVRLTSGLSGPLLVDAGLSLEDIAWLRGAGGMALGLLAAGLGTFAVRRFGVRAVLGVTGVAMALCCAALAAGSHWSVAPAVLVALVMAVAMLTAVSFVGLYAAMMDWCDPGQVATDFALLQSLDALLAIVAGVLAGQIAEHAGYAPVFLLAALLLLAALPVMRRRIPALTPDQSEQTP